MVKEFKEIYEIHGKTVYRFIHTYTNDKYLSEELTQETFLRAMNSISRYNEKCKLSVWLCQIAKHILYQEFEKNSKKKIVNIDENMDLVSTSIEELIIKKENKKDIYRAIQGLEGLTKEVVYLRLTGELSFKEIGEILDKSENWARVTFFRGKEKLVRRISDGR